MRKNNELFISFASNFPSLCVSVRSHIICCLHYFDLPLPSPLPVKTKLSVVFLYICSCVMCGCCFLFLVFLIHPLSLLAGSIDRDRSTQFDEFALITSPFCFRVVSSLFFFRSFNHSLIYGERKTYYCNANATRSFLL